MRLPSLTPTGPAFRPKGALEGELRQGMGLIRPCFKDGCEGDAVYGYGVKLMAGELGVWTCSQHRSELEAAIAAEAAKRRIAPSASAEEYPSPEPRLL